MHGHLHTIFQAIVLNRIAHAFLAWEPFLTTALSQRINGFLKRSYRYGFINKFLEIQQLLDSAMHDLFTKMQSPDHCLYLLLPSRKVGPRGHDYELPYYIYNLHKQLYIVNYLFNFL